VTKLDLEERSKDNGTDNWKDTFDASNSSQDVLPTFDFTIPPYGKMVFHDHVSGGGCMVDAESH
jgi:hypothetical protein